MIVTAVNSALEQAKQVSSAEMSKATQGFSLPGLM
jgi:DNA-binding protein YbaB